MKPHNKARQLTIDGAIWWWLCGSGGSICIWDVNHQKHVTQDFTVKGVTPDTMERGQWKGTRDGMVHPSEVVDYIKANLLG